MLLASRNGKIWLHEQLTSILCQTDVNVCIEISDDNSNDGTREMLLKCWSRNANVRLHLWEEGSGSAGANFRRLYRLVKPAGVHYVALADQDDIWHPGKLRSAIDAMESNGAHGYSCAVEAFWPDGRERVIPQRSDMRGVDFLFEGAGQGCTFVITTELFSKVQEFCMKQFETSNGLHYHDWLVYLLARAWNMRWYFDPTAWIRYRQHMGNEIGSRGNLKAILRRLEMIRNGWYRGQVAAAIDIFERTATTNDLVRRFSRNFNSTDSLSKRIKLVFFVLCHGRRRFSDRIVLAAAAAAGWI